MCSSIDHLQTMWISDVCCLFGWLAVAFAHVCFPSTYNFILYYVNILPLIAKKQLIFDLLLLFKGRYAAKYWTTLLGFRSWSH